MDSNKIKKGLGRGLSSLIGETKIESQNNQLSISEMIPNKYQPRKIFDENSLNDLTKSIEQRGILQPIIVRKSNHDKSKFEIIAGERRWRAAQLAQLDTLPVIVREFSDNEVLEIAIIENIQREDLNALEEAVGLERLRNEFELTQQEVADVVGKSRAAIANSLRLLSLGPVARELLEDGKLDMGHSRALLGLSGSAQDQAALKVADGQLSVRETEALVRKLLQEQSSPNEVKAKPAKDADTQRLERKLMDHLGAQVNIKHGSSGRGELVIKYSTLEELDGVLAHFHLSD